MLVPIAAVAGTAVLGALGLVAGGKGVKDLKQASLEIKKLEKRYGKARARAERGVDETNGRLEALGNQQEEALRSVLLRMADFLRRHQKQVREGERFLVGGVDVTVGSVIVGGRLDVDAIAWMRGVVGSATAGSAASAGVTTLVTAFGTASTGAAISGLSGAAAESATLAFLGGGSLSTGGGGMALGAVVLNVVAIGPALLVGGFVVSGQGTKALTKAQKHRAKVEVAVAEMRETRARLKAVDLRVDELSHLLARLVERGTAALDVLESEPFDAELHAARFQQAMAFAVAVRDVVATPVVDGGGHLNDETADLTVRYRPMTEDDHE